MRLRIISGMFKGRLISVPQSKLIRPMTDRVRETLFNILSNKISFEGIKVLDLYAGSGALGLECLSRGAALVHFVEKNFTIYKNLEKNIKDLEAEKSCKIFKMEALKFAESSPDKKYDLVVADPPFFKNDIYKVTSPIKENKILSPAAIMIIERSVQTKQTDIENFKVEPFRIIGDACLYQIENKES